MKKFSVTCFGTGDGWPCADRNHASFLYQFASNAILVDCGEPIDRNIKASGISYDAPDAVLLSHMHSDHVGGFFMFMQGCWLEGRRKPLPVYMPGGAIKPLGEMLKATFIFEEMISFKLQLLPLAPQRAEMVGKLRVTAFPTSHLDGARARFGKKYRSDFSAYSFLLEAGGRRVAHSADIGKPEDLEPLLQDKLDLLVCELAHFRAEDMFAYLRGRKIKQVVFVHLARDYHQELPWVKRVAAKLLPDLPHRFARDLEEVEF